MKQEADPNKRRLTRDEAVELLLRPLAGVFSSLSEGGWIHSVPVHFLYTEGQVRFLGGDQDVKTRNVERTGQGTLCVDRGQHSQLRLRVRTGDRAPSARCRRPACAR
jgi:Pyridoxamine 5'-phosphate oxidase